MYTLSFLSFQVLSQYSSDYRQRSFDTRMHWKSYPSCEGLLVFYVYMSVQVYWFILPVCEILYFIHLPIIISIFYDVDSIEKPNQHVLCTGSTQPWIWWVGERVPGSGLFPGQACWTVSPACHPQPETGRAGQLRDLSGFFSFHSFFLFVDLFPVLASGFCLFLFLCFLFLTFPFILIHIVYTLPCIYYIYICVCMFVSNLRTAHQAVHSLLRIITWRRYCALSKPFSILRSVTGHHERHLHSSRCSPPFPPSLSLTNKHTQNNSSVGYSCCHALKFSSQLPREPGVRCSQ